jgi:hypothetical protein
MYIEAAATTLITASAISRNPKEGLHVIVTGSPSHITVRP